MEPNASTHHHHEFILNNNPDIIDLGLSLRTLQPEAADHYHVQTTAAATTTGLQFEGIVGLEAYGDSNVMSWGDCSLDLYMKNSNCGIVIQSSSSNNNNNNNNNNGQDCFEEDQAEVVQSKEGWGYVKVNMDGVIVGRKVCIFHHGCYSSLALQLEDMFGRQCETGLKLFETESQFSLFYKDGDEIWRSVGDVPWKQFVEGVKRLRIARKDEAFVVIHQN